MGDRKVTTYCAGEMALATFLGNMTGYKRFLEQGKKDIEEED
jgi:hypothetical protein